MGALGIAAMWLALSAVCIRATTTSLLVHSDVCKAHGKKEVRVTALVQNGWTGKNLRSSQPLSDYGAGINWEKEKMTKFLVKDYSDPCTGKRDSSCEAKRARWAITRAQRTFESQFGVRFALEVRRLTL